MRFWHRKEGEQVTSRDIRRVAITDCGSTTTKAILIERDGDVFHQTARGDAPTTVEAPNLDITRGVASALNAIGRMRGVRLIDNNGALIRPAVAGSGQDLYLSTSSAGGGLQMVVAGLVSNRSAKAAMKAALGAGAIVTNVASFDDDIPMHEQIAMLRTARPDMVLVTGGTDGGARLPVVEIAELLAKADPKPRFGDSFDLPVIFAGNQSLREEIRDAFKGRFALFLEENVLKNADEENLSPAREMIHNLFLDHVMRQAPGFSRLTEWTDAPVIPTPSAVADMLKRTAERQGDNLLLVDIGGATTDVFTIVDGRLNRTVSANLGMSYSATEVLIQAGEEGIRRWLSKPISSDTLTNLIMNKTVRPTTIPDSESELAIEHALAREAMRLAFAHHRAFAGGDETVTVGDHFGRHRSSTAVSPMAIDTIIGSGGVISHAPDPRQSAAMLVDAFLPEGVTRLAKDTIFMMPHLGVLSRILPEAADTVFEHDCLSTLGTCIAPKGRPYKSGRLVMTYSFSDDREGESMGTLHMGELKHIPLGADDKIRISLTPARGFDVGEGPGKPRTVTVRGGPAGIILDGRGRPELIPVSESGAALDWRRVFEGAGIVHR